MTLHDITSVEGRQAKFSKKNDIFQHFFGFSSCITSTDRPSVRSEPNDVLPKLLALFDAVVAWCT
ncbi:hypothetical protein BLA27_18685 [Brucella cytisi]|uniref:Uncharacterized protein n=1 Tax=Brucella cytisi TaxID=407152 RepID=A0A1J6HUT6_9HYPH|nr:hypothetical protein BLA27_18685 [Brucella cytisi]